MTTQPVEEVVCLDREKISRAWRAFMAYRSLALQVLDSQAISFEALADTDRSLIPAVSLRLSHATEAIEHNADVIERIATLAAISTPFDPDAFPREYLEQTVTDFPDVVDGLLAIVRDWSSSGEKDRLLTYDPVIRAVEDAVSDALSTGCVETRAAFKVLVPGASLGRLVWELAQLGLTVQGVENSYLQLFMCNFIVNGTATPTNALHLYPYTHHTGMVTTFEDQVREVEFPDTNPRSIEHGEYSMVAGEFLDLYREEGRWHGVVTCFCVENSHSIISYVRRIAKILKVGGIWVNHGCLDFKFDDSLTEPSIEITSEELDLVITRCGLRIIRKETLRCKPPYVVSGMINEEHESRFTVAVRI